ncbi:helix-turn-helix transcriptional regulator [Enterococcus sp. AZ163]|uniref:helix-turn-helix transcriptional regulator n=1 Tax=Enterococcus sp. AZ163 TaxID=2774638 RepID=UPI003D2AB1AD
MQIQRLFALTHYLLANRSATAAELAQRFNVSLRTVFRDIDILSSAGIPIYTSQGTGGGIFIDNDFVLSKTTLTSEEQKKILLSLSSLAATKQDDLSFLLEKLSGLFQNQPSDLIEVDFSRWGRTGEDKDKFNKIISAISRNQMLGFSYINMQMAQSNKIVMPIKLLYKSQAWYLIGYCQEKQTYRTFKITRMSEVFVKVETFDRKNLPVKELDKTEQISYTMIPLVLKCSAEMVHRLYEDFHESQVTIAKDGTGTLRAEVPDTPWLYGFILSLGGEAEVLSPLRLRNKLCQMIKELMNRYSED